MGTIRNGGNEAFSGKAGSFIGSNWRDINYIKTIPKISKKAQTQRQLERQARNLRCVSPEWSTPAPATGNSQRATEPPSLATGNTQQATE